VELVLTIEDWKACSGDQDVVNGIRYLVDPVFVDLGLDHASRIRTEIGLESRTALRVDRWLRRHTRLTDRDVRLAHPLIEAGMRASPTQRLPDREAPSLVSRRTLFTLGRGLRTVAAIQAAGGSGAKTAIGLGFHDRSSMARHVKRVFGTTPAFVAERLGINWLLDEWTSLHYPRQRKDRPPGAVRLADLAAMWSGSAPGRHQKRHDGYGT